MENKPNSFMVTELEVSSGDTKIEQKLTPQEEIAELKERITKLAQWYNEGLQQKTEERNQDLIKVYAKLDENEEYIKDLEKLHEEVLERIKKLEAENQKYKEMFGPLP